MPFGISESAIAKAYGPTDLSGVYKGIDNAIKKYDAETKAQKQADLKEYYTNMASLNKDTEGVRAIDKPKLINLFNEWSNVSKKQMNINIQRNPKEWGKFENLKNELKSQIGTISAGSKELIKASKDYGEKMLNPNTKYDYEEGAFDKWKQNVDNKTYEEVIAGNHQDVSNYFRKDVDGSKFYEGVQKDHQAKGSTEDVKVPKFYKDKSTGVELVDYNIYKKVPKPDAIHSNIDYNLENKFKSPGERTRFIKQELNKLTSSGDVDVILKKWNALSDDNFKQLGMGKKPEFNFEKNDKETFVNLLAAKEIINSMPTAPSEIKVGEFKGGRFAEKKYDKKANFQNSMDIWREKLKEKGFGTPETFDVSPIFNTISSGGETGQKQTKELISTLNNSPLIDANSTMVVTGKNVDIPKNDKYSNYTNSKKILTALKSTHFKSTQKNLDLNDDKSIADAMNNQNLTSGLLNININPNSVRTGKVLAFSWYDDKIGLTKTAYLDIQDQESANQLNKLIKKKIDTRKQLAAAAAGLMSDVEGAFNDIK